VVDLSLEICPRSLGAQLLDSMDGTSSSDTKPTSTDDLDYEQTTYIKEISKNK